MVVPDEGSGVDLLDNLSVTEGICSKITLTRMNDDNKRKVGSGMMGEVVRT